MEKMGCPKEDERISVEKAIEKFNIADGICCDCVNHYTCNDEFWKRKNQEINSGA